MDQCHFIIPDPNAFPSGGNVYNKHLISALARKGIHISHSEFQPHVFLASTHTQYVFDSIYFNAVTNPSIQIPDNCIGLIHHLESLYPLSDAIFEKTEREILSGFSALLVTSNFTLEYLVQRGFDADSICVIEPAPMMETVERVPGEKVRALMLGSCIPRKGQLAFLEALATSTVPPYFKLTVAGSLTVDPTYARKCQELVLATPTLASCVRFIGAQDSNAIRQLYERSNLFISGAAMETFGMAIQDAVVTGMPVLACIGGYAAEHVTQGANGFQCADIGQLVQEFSRCVTDRDHFLGLQNRAIGYPPNYKTWDEGAELFSARFLDF
jgi:glycosyltransferase involved in cell wall biosynthesis